MHALEDDGGALVEERMDPDRVGDPRDGGRSGPSGLRVRGDRDRLPILHQPERGRAEGHRREDVIDVREREEVFEPPWAAVEDRTDSPRGGGEPVDVSDTPLER